jgi:hypothetical protein
MLLSISCQAIQSLSCRICFALRVALVKQPLMIGRNGTCTVYHVWLSSLVWPRWYGLTLMYCLLIRGRAPEPVPECALQPDRWCKPGLRNIPFVDMIGCWENIERDTHIPIICSRHQVNFRMCACGREEAKTRYAMFSHNRPTLQRKWGSNFKLLEVTSDDTLMTLMGGIICLTWKTMLCSRVQNIPSVLQNRCVNF